MCGASFTQGPIPLLPHQPLALGIDTLLFLSVNNLIPTIYARMRGVLDNAGRATVTVTQPNIPALAGTRTYMAFVTLDPSKPLGLRTVSNNQRFTIQP